MKAIRYIAVVFICFITGITHGDERGLPVCGYLEYVSLGGGTIQVPAKLDTGADTCSVGVQNIEPYERDGKKWVRFTVRDPSVDEDVAFNLPIKRITRIKRHGNRSEKRYVVELQARLGYISLKREFTLADRSSYDYPVLLGRNFLNGACVVDSSVTFTMGK